MSNHVFFSYSWKDRAMAMRLYNDLIRSGLGVWIDQVKGEQGVNFHQEIKDTIYDCNGFILLDSINSRRSTWVRDECQWYQESLRNNSNKQLAVCLIQPEETVFEYPELILGQNLLRYFDFSKIEVYDNDGHYNNGICRLCEHWGIDYHIFSDVGSVKDFEDELSTADVPHEERENLLLDFNITGFKLRKSNPRAEKRIEILISDCEELGVFCATPYLMLGIHQANNKKFTDACQTFNTIVKNYSKDPRGWRGLGGVLFCLKRFEEAATAFDKAIELTEAISDLKNSSKDSDLDLSIFHKTRHLHYLDITKLNKGASFFRMGKPQEALNIYKEVYSSKITDNYLHPELFIGLSDCCQQLEKYEEQESILLEGIYYFPGNCRLHIELGQLYFKFADLHRSVFHYKFVVDRECLDLEIYSEFLLLLKLNGSQDLFDEYASKALTIEPTDNSDYYYLGHIWFMIGEKKLAKQYYHKSKRYDRPYSKIWKDLKGGSGRSLGHFFS